MVETRLSPQATLMNKSRAILTRVATGERIELTKDATAGRLAECDITLNQGHASRNHARISFSEGAIWVEDLGSANGTFVNGSRISKRVKLETGDRLRFDVEEFDVLLPPPPVVKDPSLAATRVAGAGEMPLGTRLPGSAAPLGPTRVADPQPLPAPAAKPKMVPSTSPRAPIPTPGAPPRPARPAAAAEPAPVAAPVAAPAAPVPPDVVAPPAAEAPAREAAPPRAAIPSESGQKRRPGAWADTSVMGQGAKSTKYIAPAQIKQMMASSEVPAVSSDDGMEVPHLHVVAGARSGVNLPLQAARNAQGPQEWSVGSHPEREISFKDDGVSALHARIINDGDRWKVVDQMSANGTFVNGKRANVSYLAPGDRIRFGPVECVFQIPVWSRSRAGGRAWLTWVIGAAAALALLVLAYYRLRR